MSCIEITITRLGGDIRATASRLGDLRASASREGSLALSATRLGDRVTCSASRLGDFFVRIGLICGTNLGRMGILWASDGRLITIENGYLIPA